MKNKTILLGTILLTLLVSVFAVSAATITIRPASQGFYSAWTNAGCGSGTSEWQCVDEVTLNTSDNLSINSANTFETFNFSNTGLSSETINSVTLYYYGKWYSSTRKSFQPVIRSGSVNYNGTVQNWTANFTTKSQTYTTNPATGAAWTVSAVEALEAGMKSGALTYGGKIAQVYAVVDYTLAISDSCSDSDGGSVTNVTGNVTGNASGSSYNYGDVCATGTTLTEYTCSGTTPTATNISCITNTTNACSAGKCVYVPPADSCANSDGGIAITIFGNTSGYFGGTPYTNNDVCIDDSSITEYFCSGNFSNSTALSCGTDAYSGSNFCFAGDVYRSFVNYTCGSGACFNATNSILQDDCVAGEACSSGACVFNNTCFDADFGLNTLVASNVTGTTNGTGYTNYDVCFNASVVTEYGCSGTAPTASPFSTNIACNASTTCSLGRCI